MYSCLLGGQMWLNISVLWWYQGHLPVDNVIVNSWKAVHGFSSHSFKVVKYFSAAKFGTLKPSVLPFLVIPWLSRAPEEKEVE